MKKSITYAIVILGIATVVAGCGKKNEDFNTLDEATTVEAAKESTVVTETSEVIEYEKGMIEGNAYNNEWMEISFVAPDNTIISGTAKEDASMDAGRQILSQAYSKEAVDKTVQNVEREMICTTASGDAGVSIIVEHMGETGVTADEYMATLKSNLSKIQDPSISYTIKDENSIVTLGDKEYNRLIAIATQNSDSKNSLIQEYYARSKGNEIVGVIFTYPNTKEGQKEYKQLVDSFK